jgi:hypothetical protein
MVIVTLIIEAFEHVAKGPFLIMKTFSWKLYLFPRCTIPGHFLPLSTPLPFNFIIPWVFWLIDPKKGSYLI